MSEKWRKLDHPMSLPASRLDAPAADPQLPGWQEDHAEYRAKFLRRVAQLVGSRELLYREDEGSHVVPWTPAQRRQIARTLNELAQPAVSAPEGGQPPAVDELKDLLQLAANAGAFLCPLAGNSDKPDLHEQHCAACQVRAALTPGWYVAPETQMAGRARERARSLLPEPASPSHAALLALVDAVRETIRHLRDPGWRYCPTSTTPMVKARHLDEWATALERALSGPDLAALLTSEPSDQAP